MSMPALRRFVVLHAFVALIVANLRYWSTVHPRLRREILRWERRAAEIPDPALRRHARAQLVEERFNVETTASLASLAPRRLRAEVVEAAVALQIMCDYLDALGEQQVANPVDNGRRLFGTFLAALGQVDLHGDWYRHHPQKDDAGYLVDLATVARRAIAVLPSAAAITPVAGLAAIRFGEAEARAHARDQLGVEQLQTWAIAASAGRDLTWWEYAAGGAASILAVHALVASAATVTMSSDARRIDDAYLELCALGTLLDSLIDREEDLVEGNHSFVGYYADDRAMAEGLAKVARRAAEAAQRLPNGAHHHMTVAGIAAFYLSSPKARTAANRPIADAVIAELRPVITPILAIFRVWRLAKRSKDRLERWTDGRPR